jgi:hypothetical protein
MSKLPKMPKIPESLRFVFFMDDDEVRDIETTRMNLSLPIDPFSY